MDHIREAHNVPGEIRKVILEMLFLRGQSHARCICSPDVLERRAAVQRRWIIAGSSLSSAQEGPSARRVSREILGAAECTLNARMHAEYGPADRGRATRRCLFGLVMYGGSSGCFVCRASTVQTCDWSPAASTGHGATHTDRSSTHGARPTGCGGGRGV